MKTAQSAATALHPRTMLLLTAGAILLMSATPFLPSAAMLLPALLVALLGAALIIRHPDIGMVAAVVVAGLLADVLRGVTLAGDDSSSIRLAGVLALGLLLLIAAGYAAHGLVKPRWAFTLACNFYTMFFFVALVGYTLIVVGYGVIHHGIFATLTDTDWIFWTGFFLLIVIRPSYLLFKRIAIAFYGVTILQSLIGIGRLARGQATLYLSTGGDRYVSGSASVLIAIGLIISLILLLYVVREKTNVLLVLTAATLQGIGVLISFNRQTWLAMIIALTMGYVILFGGRRVRILAWAVALLIVIGAGLVTLERFDIGPVSIQQTLQSRLGAGLTFQEYLREPSMLYRISAWQKALGDIRANPLVGQGWGARFIFVVPLASGMRVYEASPHNTYLWLAAKGGLPTLFFFGALMCVLLADGIRQFHRFRRRHPHHALFLMGTILAQVIFLCGAFWWDYLTVMYLSIPFWLNCGMMAALSSARYRQLLEQNSARPKDPERISTGAYITP